MADGSEKGREESRKNKSTGGERIGAKETGERAQGRRRGERQGENGKAKLRDARRPVLRAKKKLRRGTVLDKNSPYLWKSS